MPKKQKTSPKITSTHSSMIDVAETLIRGYSLRDTCINRIALGVIKKTKQAARGKFRIKLTPIHAGILMRVRGNLYIQDIRIYTSNIQKTKMGLAEFALSKNIDVTLPKQA